MENFKKLNYRHLFYFWMTMKEGSISKAAERLDVAVQTISMQLSVLEKSIGKVLLVQRGRRLVLTEAGRIAMSYADKIFMLGEKMKEELEEEGSGPRVRLMIGVSDSLPKAECYSLVASMFQISNLRFECYEGSFNELLGDLAVHKLDIVLGQKPADISESVRFHNYLLRKEAVAVYGVPELAEAYQADFPKSLNGAPFLLPSRNHAVRSRLDRWFCENSITPKIIGEVSDGALLKTFAMHGIGLFTAPASLKEEMLRNFSCLQIGLMKGMEEKYFAVFSEQKITHKAIEEILKANGVLFQEGAVPEQAGA